MKHPLVNVVGLLVAGIILGRFVAISILPVAVTGLAFCVISLVHDRARRFLLPIVIVLSGLVGISSRHQILSPVDLRSLVDNAPQLASVQGIVCKVAQRPADDSREDNHPRFAAEIQIRHLRLGRQEWKQAYGSLIATLEFPGAEKLLPGQLVELFGILSRPSRAFAPGMFDYRNHLANRGIHFLLKSEEPSDLSILAPSESPAFNHSQRWATKTLSRHFEPDDPSIQLIRAMCLGWRTALNDQVSEPFMKSGTMHLFAISGLHVALIAGILVALLRFARIDQMWCGFIVMPALWFFTAATGWQASAIRSTIMMSVLLLAWSLRRPTDLFNTLSAAALIILLWNPSQLFQAGFQLSFAVVGTIALVMPRAKACLSIEWLRDTYLPTELQSRWKSWLNQLLRYGASSLTISFAAWLGSLPLIMHYFHLIVPISLLANVIVVQLGAGALASAVGCLGFAPFIPFMSELFANSSWFLMSAMINVSKWFSELPMAWAYVKAPPWPVILSYYLALFVGFSAPRWLAHKLRLPLLTALLIGIGISIGSQYHSNPRVTILPLGAGHAIYAENLGGEDYLIDSGNAFNYEFRTREFLISRGVNHLDHFIATHGDVSHIGGATNLLTEFVPRKVFLNAIAQPSAGYRSLESFIEANDFAVQKISDGDVFGPFTALHPRSSDSFAKSDDGTLVLLLKLNKSRMLFLNDLSKNGLRHLSERHPELRSEFLVISSAGGDGQRYPHTLQKYHPDTVIIADSIFPAKNRTTEEQKDWLRGALPQVRFLSDEGTIDLFFDPPP